MTEASIGAEFKLVAPQTPIYFSGNPLCRGPQIGIDSICHADPQDETLARAIAVFFHNAMIFEPPRRQVRHEEISTGSILPTDETLMHVVSDA